MRILRQIDQRRLAGAVGDRASLGAEAGNRGGVADGTSRRAERRRRGMGAAEGSEKVGREDRRPELLGHPAEFLGRDRFARRRRAGIVDQEIEPAERVDRRGDHRLGLAGFGDSRRARRRREAFRLEAGDLVIAAPVAGR